jgi:hypothetical protein
MIRISNEFQHDMRLKFDDELRTSRTLLVKHFEIRERMWATFPSMEIESKEYVICVRSSIAKMAISFLSLSFGFCRIIL